MPPRTCTNCGDAYQPKHPKQKYCTANCGWRYRYLNNPPCTIKDCNWPATNAGLCMTHYQRHRNTGVLGGPIKRRQRQGTTCTVEGCDRQPKHHNLCGAHLYRLKRHGSVQADIPIKSIAPKGQGYIDSNGYRKIHDRAEHRIVMEHVLGRTLHKDEHVHHINGDRLDNRPENLELWTVRRQPPGQRVEDRITDALETLTRYAPHLLAQPPRGA